MPKPVDQDRVRRREALEKKRAARRAAKQAAQQHQALSSTTNETRADNNNNKQEKDHTKVLSVHNTTRRGPSLLCSLPEESIQQVLFFLPAADLGRLMGTCQSLHRLLLLPAAAASYLLSRLQDDDDDGGGAVNLVQTESQAQDLWETALRQTAPGLAVVVANNNNNNNNTAAAAFVRYAYFLEQAVTGYGMLRSNNHNNNRKIQIPQFLQGRCCSVSPEHSLCRTFSSGDVASWGVGQRGQLGHGQRTDQGQPRLLLHTINNNYNSTNNKIRIVQVSAGGGLVRVAHSLLLTDAGQVWSFGTGQYGALGHGYYAGASSKQLPDVLRPQLVAALTPHRIVCVAAGELHSAAVSSDGDVYTWGDGFCGQLGHGDKRPQLLPKQVMTGGLHEEECVAHVTAGSRHTVAVTEDGEVFSWGLGHFGVLGRSFTPFEYDADAAVVNLAGGGEDRGRPVGRDEEEGEEPPRQRDRDLLAHLDLIANLSLDDSSNQCIPMKMSSLEGIKIVGSSAGHRHTLLLDERGDLYSCGAGSCLGHGDTQSQMYPVRIGGLDRIRQMSAGVDVSMAVSTTGEVWAWGRTDGGRIGLGLSRGEVLIPRRVVLTSNSGGSGDGKKDTAVVKAVDVECGYVHSLIVGLDGTLHMCGGVGIDGEADGQRSEEEVQSDSGGRPRQITPFNLWHPPPDSKEEPTKKKRWSKYGKYEIKGRSKMMSGDA